MHPALKIVVGVLSIIYFSVEGIVLNFIPRRMRFKDISRDIVLITGAGSGIGRLLALRFSKRGAIVVLWDVVEKANEETAEMVRAEGGTAWAYGCDITDRQTVYKVAAKVRDEVGIVTILINNAGIVNGKNLLETPDHMIEKTFQVNAISHFWAIKAFLPDMLAANRGHIVSISSLAGVSGNAKLVDYSASKFAAVGLLDSLEMELHVEGHDDICMTTVCPYFINTGLFKGAGTRLLPPLEQEYVADEIFAAVLCNQRFLTIPRSYYFLILLRQLTPTKSSKAIYDIINGEELMAGFRGRSEEN